MDCDAIIKRLKEHLKIRTDTELGRHFGLSQACVSAWRMRNRMDLSLVIEKCPDIDLNWLVRGGETPAGYEGFYKVAYERKCRECDEANARLDKVVDLMRTLCNAQDNISHEG